MVALLEQAALTTEDENGRLVTVRVEWSTGGCGQSPYCVYVQPASGEVPILGIAAWSPLGCVMAASDPDYGVWWGQASLGTGHPCTGGAAVSDYRRQRNVRGVRDGGTGASWQLGLPDGRPVPENGADVKPSSDDCYTDNSEPGVPRDVNRYVVALLRGTANAGRARRIRSLQVPASNRRYGRVQSERREIEPDIKCVPPECVLPGRSRLRGRRGSIRRS